MDASTRQDQVHRVAVADQAGQADGPEIQQGHAESAAEHPEDGVGRRHPEIAPQGQLQTASDRVSFHGGEHRLLRRRRVGPSGAVAPGQRRCSPAMTALRSAPAQNVPPTPVRTATLSPLSRS